jgi:cell division protein FtsZ
VTSIEPNNFPDFNPSGGKPVIKVIGAGGGGSNAVNRMFKTPLDGVEYISVNTDVQALYRAFTPIRVQIGERLTRGLGVGGNPETGRKASEESREGIGELVKGADLIFIAAGMGGGTGTGSAPLIAELAKESGALTVAVVTKPFDFEGSKRRNQAEEGIHKLREKVDSLIVIPNDRLSAVSNEKITMANAFALVDDVLKQAVQAIAELVTTAGDINLDFADVKSVMAQAGQSWLGIGYGRGEKRAIMAAKDAIACPLLEVSIEGSKGVLFNITGGENLTLDEVRAASDTISQVVDPDANIFFGIVTDPTMEDDVRITIIATGFPSSEAYNELRDQGLASLVGGPVFGNQEPDIDLPPFLRNSSMARRRLTNRTSGL